MINCAHAALWSAKQAARQTDKDEQEHAKCIITHTHTKQTHSPLLQFQLGPTILLKHSAPLSLSSVQCIRK